MEGGQARELVKMTGGITVRAKLKLDGLLLKKVLVKMPRELRETK
jgi:hypothetical protein